GSRKGSSAQSGRGRGPFQDDPRGRSRGGGALGRKRLAYFARSVATAGQTRAGRVFRLCVHSRARQVLAADSAAGRVFEDAGSGLDVFSRQPVAAPAGGAARSWMRSLQPVPQAGG